MIMNTSGGGGAGLNFKVVGGTTKPAAPQENTIWVNSSTEVSSWSFSPTYPALQSKTRNLIPYPYANTTKTENGVTFTVNSNGSVTVNGTATATTYFRVAYNTRAQHMLKLKKGTYTLSGCPEGGSTSTYCLQALRNDTAASVATSTTDSPGGVSFTLDTDADIRFNIHIASGTVCNNLVFWPQLEKGSTKTSFVKGDATGQVWIRTGTSSTAEFEALKRNSISICPVAAMQYISGAWVDKTAKSYIGGAWLTWVLYIYKNGMLSEISGFTMTSGTMSNSSGTLTFTSSSTTSTYMLARSTEKIDLTGLNTLTVNFLSGSKVFRASSLTSLGYAGFGITTATPSVNTSGYPRVTNYAAWRTFSHTENNNAQPQGTHTLDVSGVNGSGYLCFLGDPYDGDSSSWKAILKMDLIKLE